MWSNCVLPPGAAKMVNYETVQPYYAFIFTVSTILTRISAWHIYNICHLTLTVLVSVQGSVLSVLRNHFCMIRVFYNLHRKSKK